MTRAALRALFRVYVQEASTTPLTDAIANDLLNEAKDELADIAEYSFATFTYTGGLVTDRYDYDLPGTLLRAWTVAVQDASGNLTPLSDQRTQQEMEQMFPSWRTDAAAKPDRWWPVPGAIWLHPKPSLAYNGTPLELKGPRTPPDMDTDGSVPVDLPDKYHRTIAKYAAWRWLAIDKDSSTAQRWAMIWKSEFERDAAKLRALVRGRFDTDYAKLRFDPGFPSDLSFALEDEV